MDVKGSENLLHCDRAPLLAMDTCACPEDPEEPISCETMEARDKLAVEALLKEQKTILGWYINFRQLIIKLPENKLIAWLEVIEIMLKDGTTMAKVLKMNIGRLVHLGLAIPFVHHLMSRLRDLHMTAKRRHRVKINGEHQKDLMLMLNFLKIACEGISLNSITF